jgi:hypothetical protein
MALNFILIVFPQHIDLPDIHEQPIGFHNIQTSFVAAEHDFATPSGEWFKGLIFFSCCRFYKVFFFQISLIECWLTSMLSEGLIIG